MFPLVQKDIFLLSEILGEMSQQNYEWKFQQAFGDSKVGTEEAQEGKNPSKFYILADIISSVEFDTTGNYLAIGDRGGRVVILQRNDNKSKVEYKVVTEFQSHEPEFDYLKSLEIEEKINQIRWLKKHPNSHFLLTTNDKTIKLWKVYNKSNGTVTNLNFTDKSQTIGELKVPKMVKGDNSVGHQVKKTYSNAHAYNINSISLNSDGETFLSADDLRINLWNINHHKESLNFVDIKPGNMEDLTEVITCAKFHPIECNTFLYSSSKGALKVGDLRQSTTVSSFEKSFEVEEDPSTKTFFSEIIASISDCSFSHDGMLVMARDYMSIKVWDVRMEKKPVSILMVHEGIRSKLCDLYESDCIFDKFEACFGGDSSMIYSGSYKNNFHVFDTLGTKSHDVVEATRSTRKSIQQKSSNLKTKKKKEDFDTADFTKKCLHMSVHPKEDVVSVAVVNNLYIYTKSDAPVDEKE
jgi:serine/threonine-protein phosphatase 2A regulatory subunit B